MTDYLRAGVGSHLILKEAPHPQGSFHSFYVFSVLEKLDSSSCHACANSACKDVIIPRDRVAHGFDSTQRVKLWHLEVKSETFVDGQ